MKLFSKLLHWWRRRLIRQQLLATTSIALLLFFGTLLLFAQTTHRLLAILHQGNRFEQTLATVKNLDRMLATIEMNVWAYAASGRPDFLRAHHVGFQTFQYDVERIQTLLADSPADQRRFTQAIRHARQWRNQFAAPAIASRRAGRDARDILATTQARDTLQLFTDELEAFTDLQQQQLLDLHAEAEAMVRRMVFLGLFLSIIGILGTLWLTSWVARSLTQPLEQLLHAIERVDTHGEAAPIRFRQPPEMARLGDSFNRMVATLHRHRRDLEAFHTFSEQLRHGHRVEELWRTFLQAVQARFQPQQTLVLTPDTQSQVLEVAQRLRPDDRDSPAVMSHPQTCPAVRGSRPYGIADTSEETACRCELDVPRRAGSYYCLPVQGGGSLLGLVCLTGPRHYWTGERRQDAVRYVEQLAAEVFDLQLFSRAHQQAMVDDLTQVYNRRFAEEYLQKLLALSRRTQRPFAVFLLDLDHFKALNDCFGHAAGDRLLRAFAGVLVRHVRRSAIAARWGGDEFLVVVPEVGLGGAALVAERLRAAVAQMRLDDPVADLAITVSIGTAVAPYHGSHNGELLAAADKALYRAKKAGRNRVEVASGVPSIV